MIKFRKWSISISIGVLGALLAFIVTNYWAYTSGRDSGRMLLIDTLSKYRQFYEEVRKEHKIACGQDGKLKGLYLSQFKSMLPVIEDEIEPPYDNPCPSLSPPAPPKITGVSFCQQWETWADFLKEPKPYMSLNFPEGVLRYPIGDEWRNAIINWHDQIVEAKEKAAKQCPEGKSCEFKFKAGFCQ